MCINIEKLIKVTYKRVESILDQERCCACQLQEPTRITPGSIQELSDAARQSGKDFWSNLNCTRTVPGAPPSAGIG